MSGIVYVIKHGLQWKDAPEGYGRVERALNAEMDHHLASDEADNSHNCFPSYSFESGTFGY